MIEKLESATVGEIVAADFRAAAVFEGVGIDFCCGGRRSLPDACRSAAVDPAAVRRALSMRKIHIPIRVCRMNDPR
jgi:regulator of cell morphogenesis and NO signaling